MSRLINKIIVLSLFSPLTSFANGLNADGLPTSVDSHVQLACDLNFKQIATLPKQTQDNFWAKNSKANLCNCAKSKIKNDPAFTIDGARLTDDAPLYSAFKKYREKDIDPVTGQGYVIWSKVIYQALKSCVKE